LVLLGIRENFEGGALKPCPHWRL